MVEMSNEIIQMFENIDKRKDIVWIATATKEGDPHLAPVCFVRPIDKDKLLIGTSSISKTALNIKKGSRVALGNAAYPYGYMIKGRGEIVTEGKYFEDFKEYINISPSVLACKFGGKIQPEAVVLVNVEEVYQLKSTEGRKKII